MKIIIIGGGIGGMACAALFAAQGHQVLILEQAPQTREVGAGLQISPNGLAVLRQMGLERALINLNSPRAQAVSLRDYRRMGEIARLDLQRLTPQQAYYFVHRADLLTCLKDCAEKNGAEVRLNSKVENVVLGHRPSVQIEDAGTVAADLVIGADGVHSVARRVLNPESQPAFTSQVAWRAVVPNVIHQPPEARVYMGPGKHVVAYPLRGGDWVNLVAVHEQSAWHDEGWHHASTASALRHSFSEFEGEAANLLSAVDQVMLWGLFLHPIARHWVGQGLALMGDAAHPMLPFLAQGANMALEDAWVLAATVQRGQLERYQSLRHARVQRVLNTTKGNAKRYHMAEGPMRFAAHMALKTISKTSPSLMLRPFDWLYGTDVTAPI